MGYRLDYLANALRVTPAMAAAVAVPGGLRKRLSNGWFQAEALPFEYPIDNARLALGRPKRYHFGYADPPHRFYKDLRLSDE